MPDLKADMNGMNVLIGMVVNILAVAKAKAKYDGCDEGRQ